MNWPEQCAILACAMNTPLPEIWKFTLGQFVRYTKAINAVMPFHNPFAGGGSDAPRPSSASDKPDTASGIMALKAMGFAVDHKDVKNA